MEYNLAKQLEKAGFSQEGRDDYFDSNGKYCNPTTDTPDCANPTLEELIESCGDEFKKLENYNNEDYSTTSEEKWKVYSSNIEESGNTPEEAVAMLWLELHRAL